MRQSVLCAFVVAHISSTSALGTRGDAQVQPVAFVNVNVIPMDSERVLLNQTVLVQGDQIAAVGPSATTDVSPNALRIDGTGKYLMPGLADMHVHFIGEEDGLTLFVANGVTTVRNMFGGPDHLDWRKRVKKGSLFGPTIYTTGPITDGDPPYWPGSSVVTTPGEAENEVIAQKEAGYDGIKIFDNLQPDVFEAIITTAQRLDIPVYGHVPVRVGMERALEMGQRSFEHMNDFLYALIPAAAPSRAGLIEAAADKSKMSLQSVLIQPFKSADPGRVSSLSAKFATSDAWLCPTLQLLENLGSTKEEFQAMRESSAMRYVAPDNWAYWNRFESMLTSEQGDPVVLKRAHMLALRSVKALHEAGGRIVAGTDSPNPFLVPGFALHQELNQLLQAGLTPFEAIRAATLDAAQFVDALDEFGTVSVGRRADLLLLNANPLEDVGHAAEQVGVMLRGKWYPQAQLQAKLDALAARYERQRALATRVAAIEHVNVIPMDSERVLADQTVVVRGERIESIDPADSATVPNGATRIDGTGKYLMPGLADMHAHIHPVFIQEQDLVLLVANGVTTVRNMWGTPTHFEWRKRVEAGDLLGPTIYTTGPILEGDPPVQRGSTIVTNAKDARQAVRDQKNAGYDFIKIYHTLSKETFDAIISAGDEFGISVVGHVPNSVRLEYALDAGQHSIEHLWGYSFAIQASTSPYRTVGDFKDWKDWFRTWNHVDPSKIPPLAAATKLAGTWNCPTLVTPMSKNLPEETEQKLAQPEARYVSPKVRTMWAQREMPEEIVNIARRSHAIRLQIVRALHDQGAGLLLGTDFPGSFVIPGFSIHQELQYLVDAGLTPFEAISTGTTNAAEYFGAADEFGTVAAGQRADLLLVEGNPLDDIRNTSKQAGVMLRGRWYSRAELQTKLDELAAHHLKNDKKDSAEDR